MHCIIQYYLEINSKAKTSMSLRRDALAGECRLTKLLLEKRKQEETQMEYVVVKWQI